MTMKALFIVDDKETVFEIEGYEISSGKYDEMDLVVIFKGPEMEDLNVADSSSTESKIPDLPKPPSTSGITVEKFASDIALSTVLPQEELDKIRTTAGIVMRPAASDQYMLVEQSVSVKSETSKVTDLNPVRKAFENLVQKEVGLLGGNMLYLYKKPMIVMEEGDVFHIEEVIHIYKNREEKNAE